MPSRTPPGRPAEVDGSFTQTKCSSIASLLRNTSVRLAGPSQTTVDPKRRFCLRGDHGAAEEPGAVADRAGLAQRMFPFEGRPTSHGRGPDSGRGRSAHVSSAVTAMKVRSGLGASGGLSRAPESAVDHAAPAQPYTAGTCAKSLRRLLVRAPVRSPSRHRSRGRPRLRTPWGTTAPTVLGGPAAVGLHGERVLAAEGSWSGRGGRSRSGVCRVHPADGQFFVPR